MFDLIIKNGKIVDGSGNPFFKANIAIQGGKIVQISRADLGDAKRVIDAHGWIVSPGFCDLHTHSDLTILFNQNAKSSLHAGVTTEGVGQCGTGAYPFEPGYEPNIAMEMAQYAKVPPDQLEINWHTLGEWRSVVEAKGIGINLAPYLPHGVIRNSVMGVEGQGGERYEPTAEELERMKALVRQGMLDGAFGLSTGLRYPWGRNSYTEEVIEMARVVSEHNGIYISHMRSESDTLIESARELIQICEEADLPGCMSHHKAVFPENWGKVCETTRLIDRARARGLEIMCDFYPWVHAAEGNLGGSFLQYVFTPDMKPEDMLAAIDNLLEIIMDGETWERIKKTAREQFEQETAQNEERKKVLAKRGIKAPDLWNPATFNYIVSSQTHPEVNHKNLREAAQILGMEDFMDAARKVYVDDQGTTLTAGGIMCEEDVVTILKHPYSSISTDGAAFDEQPDLSSPILWAHPRNYGTFAKVFQEYVREQKLLRLEEVVRKMTSLPLQFLGVRDRGLIREGMWADITIFDTDKITNHATFANPAVYPTGIQYVLVNGQVALDKDEITGALAGKVLTHN
jgi:N-acyl-D-amino-acid deacylase